MDPPYGIGLETELFSCLKEKGFIGQQTLVVVESHTDNAPLTIVGAKCLDYRVYGGCALSFLRLDVIRCGLS